MFISFRAFSNSLLWYQENSYGILDQKIVMVSLQNFIYLLSWWWWKNLKASKFFCRWKIHEACMLALGSVKSIITDSVKNGRIHFDMHGFLTNVVLADLNLSGILDLAITQSNCWVPDLGNLLQTKVSDESGCCMHVVLWNAVVHIVHVKGHKSYLVSSHMLPCLI